MKWVVGLFCLVFFSSVMRSEEHVVLLHGLTRSAKSMEKLEYALRQDGYRVHNIDYPSCEQSIGELATFARGEIDRLTEGAGSIHLVTHSMGGILARQMASDRAFPNLGRVVMLSPPNHGSEVVDWLGDWKLFQWINGPAGSELGTDENSTPNKLGPATFELGIVTGDRTVNLILSTMIPGKNDGKVSVESAKLDGMKAFRVIHATHSFIMGNRQAIDLTRRFLARGQFEG